MEKRPGAQCEKTRKLAGKHEKTPARREIGVTFDIGLTGGTEIVNRFRRRANYVAHLGAKRRAAYEALPPAKGVTRSGAVKPTAGTVVTGIRGRVAKDAVRPALGVA